MSWSLITGFTNPDTFTRANGAVGNGWTTINGTAAILSNTLSFTGRGGYAVDHLEQDASPFPTPDQRLEFDCVCPSASGGNLVFPALRRSSDGTRFYYFWGGSNGDSALTYGYYNSGFNDSGTFTTSSSFVSGKSYRFTYDAVGTSPTTLTLTVQNLTDSTTILNAATWSNSTSALQSAGYAALGICNQNSGNSRTFTRAAIYQSTPLLLLPDTLTLPTSNQIKFAIDLQGGSSPYTVNVYRSTTAGFTPGAGNLISGIGSISGTTVTVTDTTALVGVLYYYKVSITDSSSTATTNQIPFRLNRTQRIRI